MKLRMKHLDLAARITYGLKKAAANVMLEHKRAGRAIVVYRNGAVVQIPPEEIVTYEVEPPEGLDL